MPGVIALDIDGTVTVDFHLVPEIVVNYLQTLVQEEWKIIFITGRTFHGAMKLLGELPFPYYLAVQNGALTLEMPNRHIVAKKYLDRSIITKMEAICNNSSSDFVVYAGFEHQDVCYFRPQRFSSELLVYLKRRIENFHEVWIPLKEDEELPIDNFPSVKCFGKYQEAAELVRRIETELALHVPLVQDPFNSEYYVVQAIHPEISKGKALQDVVQRYHWQGKIIAAGNDRNDCSMWDVADVKIIMENAPETLLKGADIIAPAASKQGIIQGLKHAINLG